MSIIENKKLDLMKDLMDHSDILIIMIGLAEEKSTAAIKQ